MKLRRLYRESIFQIDLRQPKEHIDPLVSVELWTGPVVLLHLGVTSRSDVDDRLEEALGELIVRVRVQTPRTTWIERTLEPGWNVIGSVSVADGWRVANAALDAAWRVVFERVSEFERDTQ